MLRTTVTAVVVAGCLVSLAACSNETGATPGNSGGKSTTISFAYWGANEENATIKSMVAAFEKAHPDIHIEPNWIQSDYEQKLQTSIAGGDAPTVAVISNTSLPSFYSAFKPVSVDTGAYYSPAVAKAGNVDGTDYTVPFVAKSKVMAIDKASFTKAGLRVPSGKTPLSTGDFVTAAQKMTSGSGPSKTYGSAPLWFDGWLMADGGSYYNADGTKCTMGDTAGIRAAKTVVDSQKPGGFAPTTIAVQGQDMFQWLKEGKVAMLPDFGPWNIAQFAALDTSRFLLVPMPGRGEPMEVDGLGITKSASAAQTTAAEKFTAFMSSDPAAQNLLASKTSALGVPVVKNSLSAFQSAAPKANLQAFINAVTNAVTTPYVKNKVQIESTFSTALDSRTAIGTGHEDPATVLPQLQNKCQQMLDATK
ncbi:extracellular solute-binding protein [Streptomyces brasiliensis]|uniref:Sugar ABC transporter substrate-binding protein n=1 Tax=Streptomyces brasiliensis TaxID=1954 RepID=A0A917LAI9_9ACTN|nr:extracellular solute-binding protein [Streptomyces brasiliensis]GGJ50587.1 sugar ABC transporter substrate-binding protein [Streptomyces brasiliensis]